MAAWLFISQIAAIKGKSSVFEICERRIQTNV